MIYFSQQMTQMKQIGTRYACASVRMANASEALRYLLNQLNQLTIRKSSETKKISERTIV